MMDYSAILDDEVIAFLERSARFYPDDAVDLSIAEQRRVYNAMCAEFDVGYPPGVVSQERDIGGVKCRVYSAAQSSEATIFFCHGGGFVVGDLDSHDSICAEFCARTGFRVVAVEYRLSPEHPYPDDFNDAVAAFVAVCQMFTGPIVLCGDSAGGNLVAAVAHHARALAGNRITGQLLIYPGLGGAPTKGSYVAHADAPGLSTRDMAFYAAVRSAGQDRTGDPSYAPLQDTDFTGLPPTVVITAECDPLSSDGEAYRDALSKAGGAALWIEEKGLVHAYLRARHMSAKAGASFDRMVAALKALATAQLPELTSEN